MERIGHDRCGVRADVGACVVGDLALNGEAGARAAGFAAGGFAAAGF